MSLLFFWLFLGCVLVYLGVVWLFHLVFCGVLLQMDSFGWHQKPHIPKPLIQSAWSFENFLTLVGVKHFLEATKTVCSLSVGGDPPKTCLEEDITAGLRQSIPSTLWLLGGCCGGVGST